MSWVKNNEWLKPQQNETVHWRYLKRFLSHYQPFRGHLAVAATLALLGAITAVLIPLIFRAIQAALSAQDTTQLLLAVGAFLALSLFDIGMTYLIHHRTVRVFTWLNRRLVIQYYEKILNLAVEDFMAFRRRTNLFQRIIDAMGITEQFTNILIRGGQKLIVTLVVATVIGLLSPMVLAVIALGSAALFAHVVVQARKLAKLRQRSLSVNYPLVGKMSEVIDGLFTIKALAASVKVTSDVDHLVSGKSDAEFDERRTEVRSDQLGAAIRVVTLVGSVVTSFVLMLQGQLLLADVFALYVLVNLLLMPVSELGVYFQQLSRLSVNVKNFYEVLDLDDEAAEARAALEARTLEAPNSEPSTDTDTDADAAAESVILKPSFPVIATPRPHTEIVGRAVEGHVEFRNVSFAYRDGKRVLHDISLEIQPGEKISLIGRSGVGKTTLIRVLLGFLQPQQGQVLVDGVDIATLPDKNAYRRRFGVVSQRDFLFGTSIRENLTFGLDQGLAEDRLVEALRLVNLWDDVASLAEALDTHYSPDLFSGGQQQRFFIARALLRDPSIVLLDEPTSALDFESEQLVLQALDQLVGDNTTLTIAHRLSTVRSADRVVVLHEGRVQAVGPHEHLYAEDDYYRSLCDYNSFVA